MVAARIIVDVFTHSVGYYASIGELLPRAARCAMHFRQVPQRSKARSALIVQSVKCIAHHVRPEHCCGPMAVTSPHAQTTQTRALDMNERLRLCYLNVIVTREDRRTYRSELLLLCNACSTLMCVNAPHALAPYIDRVRSMRGDSLLQPQAHRAVGIGDLVYCCPSLRRCASYALQIPTHRHTRLSPSLLSASRCSAKRGRIFSVARLTGHIANDPTFTGATTGGNLDPR